MKPLRQLPENYIEIGSLNLEKNTRALLILNLIGAGLLVLSGWLFIRAAFWLRPDEAGQVIRMSDYFSIGLSQALRWIALLLAITAGMLLLHEAIHGLFFWLFTKMRPVFGIGPGYAYAAAPGWFLPGRQYLVVGLAPLVVISVMSFLLLAVAPPGWFLPVILFASFNASGAVGDIAVAIWLLRQSRECLANDRGDAVTLYKPVTGKG